MELGTNDESAQRNMVEKKKKRNGTIFLGKDEKTYGIEGIGHVDYDPDFECGGPEGTPGRQCAFETKEYHTNGLSVTGSEGRKLHISIASFRDPLCPKTLYYLFTKAKYPEKLRIRVLEQSVLGVDVDCKKTYCKLIAKDKKKEGGAGDEDPMKDCQYADQILIHHLDAGKAAGPTWARGLLSIDMEKDYKHGLVDTQDHCMSIDSHMNVEPEWDDKMVSMWDDAKNEYAVLSTYVVDVEHLGKNDLQVPHLCMVTFTSNVRTTATKCVYNLPKPKLTNAVWGAGLSFSKCHAELKVMVDPHTPHVFDGEEFNRAARFFTHGYDIYTPNRVYILHDYHKSQSNPIQSSWHGGGNGYGSLDDSNIRLKTMIDVPGGETDPLKALKLKQSKYGLGDRRSLDQLIQFSGIDLRHKKPSIDGKNRCGNIRWVPFLEHTNGVNYIPEFNNTTEDPLDLPYDKGSVWYFSQPLAIQKETGNSGDNDQDAGYVPRNNKLQEDHANDDGKAFVPEKNNLQSMHAQLAKELAHAKNQLGHIKIGQTIDAVKQNVRRKAQNGIFSAKGFLVNHSIVPPEQHGFQQLPAPIQISVIILILGFIVSIGITAGKGRAYMRKTRTL